MKLVAHSGLLYMVGLNGLDVLPQFAVGAISLNLARGHILDLDNTLDRVKKPVRSNVHFPVVLRHWIVHTCPTRVAFAVMG